jgi:hypothetical protein
MFQEETLAGWRLNFRFVPMADLRVCTEIC